MAKKQPDMSNIFARTERGDASQETMGNEDLDRGNIQATGIGLRKGELEALQVIADELGVARNAVMRFLVRWAIMQYRQGKVDIARFAEEPPPSRKILRMP
jgi:hypothetical protein